MRPRSFAVIFCLRGRLIGLCALLLATAGARTASAQNGLGGATGTTAATFGPDDFAVVVQQERGQAFSQFNRDRFFNIANCQCKTPVYVYFTLTQSGFQKRTVLPQGTIEFWTGANCYDNTASSRSTRCAALNVEGSNSNSMPLATFAARGGVIIPTDSQVLSQYFGLGATTTAGAGGSSGTTTGNPGPAGPDACETGFQFSQTFWLLVRYQTSTSINYDIQTSQTINVDLAPPPDVDHPSFKAEGGNEGIVASWSSIDTSTTIDLLGYQVLCDRGGDLQVFKTDTFTPAFHTCETAPHSTVTPDLGINSLDPKFVCSPLLSQLATSYRIKILENGVNYGVSVVGIDTHYNPTTPFVIYAAPQPTRSFYDVYRNGDSTNQQPGDKPDPGRASGGYCTIAAPGARGAGQGMGAAAMAATLAVMLARRRRGRRP